MSTSQWLQLVLWIPEQDAEIISDYLTERGALAVTLQDAADQPIFEPAPGATPLWAQVQLTGLFTGNTDLKPILTELQARFGQSIVEKHCIQPLAEQNWQERWEQSWQPLQFGERLWICPSHRQPPDPRAINVLLEPGLAFGTGTHPTTQLCLRWLAEHLPPQCSLIDYGCGSGILAIAAAKLGAHKLWAVDHDPQALEATEANVARNHLPQQLIQTLLPNQLPPLQADVLVANILANPLIELAGQFARHLKTHGHIVLSGILVEQAKAVAEAYEPWFILDAPVIQEDWVRLTGIKRTNP